MLLERSDPNPRKAVRLLWSGEKVRPEYPLPSPTVDERVTLEPGKHVVSLNGLVRMKIMANRDQDRVHLRDLIDVGLIARLASNAPIRSRQPSRRLTERSRPVNSTPSYDSAIHWPALALPTRISSWDRGQGKQRKYGKSVIFRSVPRKMCEGEHAPMGEIRVKV